MLNVQFEISNLKCRCHITWVTGGMPSAESAVSRNMAPVSSPSRPSCARHSRRGRQSIVRPAQPARNTSRGADAGICWLQQGTEDIGVSCGDTHRSRSCLYVCKQLCNVQLALCRRLTRSPGDSARNPPCNLPLPCYTWTAADVRTSCDGQPHCRRRSRQQRQDGDDPNLQCKAACDLWHAHWRELHQLTLSKFQVVFWQHSMSRR